MEATYLLQTKIKSVVDSLVIIQSTSSDVGKIYWATDAHTQIAALTSDTDATTLTKLTKLEYTAGITFCDNLASFFSYSAVATADYLATCYKLKYGSHPVGTKLSEPTEQIGNQMIAIASTCTDLFKTTKEILSVYLNNEISDMIANLDIQRRIPGSQMTKDELSTGITLVEQFKKLLNNEAVTTADYSATLSKWQIL